MIYGNGFRGEAVPSGLREVRSFESVTSAKAIIIALSYCTICPFNLKILTQILCGITAFPKGVSPKVHIRTSKQVYAFDCSHPEMRVNWVEQK
jgi:hypothetical protein